MGCGASNAATSVVSNSPPNNAPIARSTGSNRQHTVPPSQASLPLVKAKNYRHGAPITQGELNNQRTEFWSTRTEGNTIMWQSIRSAADAMLNNDLTLANAILEASNLSSPNGTLEVIYDERGFQYKVPQYCYANPLELTNEPVKAVIAEPAPSESGKNADNGSVSAGGPTMKVRVRINPGDHNLTIAAELNGTILNMKQLLVKEVEEKFPQITAVTVQRQRIIFMGKELQNTLKVKDAKFDDAKVVQVFLRPAQ